MIQYNPLAIYEQRPDKGGVCEPKTVAVTLTGATNNQTVIAAVTGKKILVLSGNICSLGAAGLCSFKNGSGGTAFSRYYIPANTVASPNVSMNWLPDGLFQTTSGTGVFADNASGDLVAVSLRYIEIT